MAEVYTNPFTVTLAAAYTSGSGTLSVSAAAPTAIQGGTFSVALGNGTGGAASTVLTVTGGASTTTWTVSAEYNDANAPINSTVYGCELSPRVMRALFASGTPISATQNVVTASRAIGTVYQNTNNYPILVCVACTTPNGSDAFYAFVGQSSPPTTQVASIHAFANCSGCENNLPSFVVPAGNYYKITNASGGSPAIIQWVEWSLSGGGGGVNPLGLLSPSTPPASSSLTWLHQNTATATDVNGLSILMPPGNSSTNWSSLLKTFPTGSFTFTVGMRLTQSSNSGDTVIGGIVISDGTKLVTFGWGRSGSWTTFAQNYSSSTAYAGNISLSSPGTVFLPSGTGVQDVFLRVAYNGTNFTLLISFDGTNYQTLGSVSATAYLTPTLIGIGGLTGTATSTQSIFTFYWSGI